MSKKEKDPSEALTEFLEYINGCREQYQAAHESVKTEERRLQDLLHELELAEGETPKDGPLQSFETAAGSEEGKRTRQCDLS